ncbi:MAG: hypothetical protein NXI30_23205 [bacterium]|nr:hypothetical protein [bacterium]
MSGSREVVLVGTGAFVTRDAWGPGVLARSIAQWCGDQPERPWTLTVVHRSTTGRERFEREWKAIEAELPRLPTLRFLSAGDDALADHVAGARALFVCVPDDAHAAYVELGIAARTPTWIVKPLTGEGPASAALVEAARVADVPVWVDYHKRFDVSNRGLRDALDREELGAPRLVSVRYSQPRDLPLDGFTWAGGTDVFTYIGCHYVDQLFYVMPGLEIEHVEAHGLRGPVHAQHGGQAFDTVLARFDGRWRDRPLSAQFEVGWCNPLGSPTKSLQIVEVACDGGRHFLDQARRGSERWSDQGVHVPNPWFFSRVHDPLTGSARYQGYGYDSVRHFLDFTGESAEIQAAMRTNASLPWIEEAARVDAVLDRVREALEDA